MKLPKELNEDGVKMKKNKWWASGVLVGKLLLSCGKHDKVAQKTVRPVIFIPIFEQQMFDKLIE